MSDDTYTSVFAAWYRSQPTEWRSAVAAIIDQCWIVYPPANEANSAVNDELRKLPEGTRDTLEELLLPLYEAIAEGAAIMGYALAKTWPSSLEELHGWMERAAVYGRLDTPALTVKQAQNAGILSNQFDPLWRDEDVNRAPDCDDEP